MIDGKGWRTGAEVQKSIISMVFKITHYAEELLQDLDKLSLWPEKVKTMQRNWIGKSTGAEIQFKIDQIQEDITVFTTRPDTIYGASFIALSINHPLVSKNFSTEKLSEIKKEFEEINDEKQKIGYQLDIFCQHPILDKKLPVFVANFVLDSYREGAIFGCPAHDERDLILPRNIICQF